MKKKHNMSKWIIIFVIASIFIFTVAAMWVQVVSGVELSSTLITCFFGFCTRRIMDAC